MIEIFLIDLIKKNQNQNKEHNNVEHFSNNNISIWNIFWFFVSCAAVYLSWTCNSNTNINIVFRILFAIFAFIFGIIYIICNYIFFQKCHI